MNAWFVGFILLLLTGCATFREGFAQGVQDYYYGGGPRYYVPAPPSQGQGPCRHWAPAGLGSFRCIQY